MPVFSENLTFLSLRVLFLINLLCKGFLFPLFSSTFSFLPSLIFPLFLFVSFFIFFSSSFFIDLSIVLFISLLSSSLLFLFFSFILPSFSSSSKLIISSLNSFMLLSPLKKLLDLLINFFGRGCSSSDSLSSSYIISIFLFIVFVFNL